ncbi:MAG: exodeoxyribonuclease VII subunit XseA [Sodalis sp. Fse]|nr:MAG: exodeoxyribonuclease VII subunit XseA [Sodalis sp. Fse]
MDPTIPSSIIFTVSRLNKTVRKLLEDKMGQVWISGEISNFSQPTSGHWYFTLKDDRAQVRCVMFCNCNRRTTFAPHNGQQVLTQASITLYELRGDYQLIAENMQPTGDGFLQRQFEHLKHQLRHEGLFDQQHKKTIPSPANKVGIITSASGAALHDILQVLKRRDPSLPVVIYPTAVQGADAPCQIVHAIQVANQRKECDILIIGRGGGSLEDLSSFNDERVARAIFTSLLPVISAVGHEVDITIADFVADLRAPTPSSAAELVSRNRLEILRQIQLQQQRLEMAIDYFLAQRQQMFNLLLNRLQQQHPQLRLARQQTVLMTLHRQLCDCLQTQLRQAQRSHEWLRQKLTQQMPTIRISRAQQLLQTLIFQLNQSMNHELNQQQNAFVQLCSQLEGLNPLKTLTRGFSVTTNQLGIVIKHTRQLNTGDQLITHLRDGYVKSKVTNIIQ